MAVGAGVTDGPIPSTAEDLRNCVIRFLCASQGKVTFPLSPVALNADLRRAYQKAGHARAALSVFRATSTGEAIRSIAKDLDIAGFGDAMKLEDAGSSDDLLVLEADLTKIRNILLSSASVKKAPPSAPQGTAPGRETPVQSTSAEHAAPPATSVAREPAVTVAKKTMRHDEDDDELSRLLAEPTVKRKEWEPPTPKEPKASNGGPEGVASQTSQDNDEKAGSQRPRPEETSMLDDGDLPADAVVLNAPVAPPMFPPPMFPPPPPPLPLFSLPPPPPVQVIETLVFTPDMDSNTTVPNLEEFVMESSQPRSLSSVGRGEWVSAASLTEMDTKRVAKLAETYRDRSRSRGERGGRNRGRSRSRNRNERPEKLPSGTWEEARARRGLKLTFELVGLPWTYPVIDEGRRSYAGSLKHALTAENSNFYFQRIRDGTDWQQPEGPMGKLPRKTAWMVGRGCTCTYRYGGIEVLPAEFPPWMIELMHTIMPMCGITHPNEWPNSCNVNLYEDGGMSVGWHSDDERLFQGKHMDCRIISLSLGAERRFDLRLNWPEEGERPGWSMHLGNGDLLTMEGMMQKHFQHRVPREENVRSPRINLTWRWVQHHITQCPAKRGRRR